MRVIDRFYGIDKPQDPPDDMVLAEMGKSWDIHLSHAKPRPVPTDRIEEVYEEAIIGYENKGPFGIFELLDAWKRICLREARPALAQTCTWSEGHIDEDLNVEGVLMGGYECVLPCPSCRPEAHRQRRIKLLEELAQARAAEPVQDIAAARRKSASKKAAKKPKPPNTRRKPK